MCSRLNDVGSSLFAYIYDDVKKLLATSDSHDGIINSDTKGSIFGKSLMSQLCKCELSRHISVSCDSIPNHISYGTKI